MLDKDYKSWLKEVKTKIQSSQIKAAIAVNSALIEFYYDLGKMIVEKQKNSSWGNKLIEKLSLDLKAEFPKLKGFSKTNLKYCKNFYLFYNEYLISQQLVDQLQEFDSNDFYPHDNDGIIKKIKQIPWGHNIIIFTKIVDKKEAFYYIQKTISNNWSRDRLAFQIKNKLYQREGKAITNFENRFKE